MNAEQSPNPAEALHSIIQLGIVVEDLDAVIASMKRIFNLEPALTMECDYPLVTYQGEAIDARSRIAKFDHYGVLLEFVEPAGDASMWSDALQSTPNGAYLHHIRMNDVPDNDAITNMMAERGVELLQEGTSVVHPSCRFSFYDTQKELGFVTEVVTDISHKA